MYAVSPPQTSRPLWYEKYATGMNNKFVRFKDFTAIFLYTFLSMQSMRFPPHTRPWYEKGVICIFWIFFMNPFKKKFRYAKYAHTVCSMKSMRRV